MRWRILPYGAGVLLVLYGFNGMLRDAADTHPFGWALWFLGVAVVHDLLFAPTILAAGLLTRRIPRPYRRVIQPALAIATAVALIALPIVLALGERPDDPSALPLPYPRNLAIVLALIATAALATCLKARRRRGARRAAGGAPGDDADSR